MKKDRGPLMMFLGLSLLMSFCGPKPPNKGFVDSVPEEIQALINSKYKESIHAVGTATGPKEAIAKDKAVLNARAEIARIFKTQVDALQKGYQESVNDKSVDEYQQAVENFASLEISGSQMVKSMVRAEKNGVFTAKVLVVVSAEHLRSLIDEKMQAYTSFKASKAYKELEERVRREKEILKNE